MRLQGNASHTGAIKAHPVVKEGVGQVLARMGSDLKLLCGKKILITGGTGFFGQWLLETVFSFNTGSDTPCKVYVPTRNAAAFMAKAPHIASNPALCLMEQEIESFQYPEDDLDYIIHAAASADPKSCMKDPIGVAETIVRGTGRVLDLAVEKKVDQVLFVSSGAVYGRQPAGVEKIGEEYTGGPDTKDEGSAYGEAKRYAELLCALYKNRRKLPVKIVRPFTFVGPYQDLNSGFAVTDFIRCGIEGKPIIVQGDGTTIRSYCYAADLTVMLLKALLMPNNSFVMNLGSDQALSILELARLVASFFETPPEIQVLGKPSPGTRPARYLPDTHRMKAELGMDVFTDIRTAVFQTLGWMKSVLAGAGQGESYPFPLAKRP